MQYETHWSYFVSHMMYYLRCSYSGKPISFLCSFHYNALFAWLLPSALQRGCSVPPVYNSDGGLKTARRHKNGWHVIIVRNKNDENMLYHQIYMRDI